MTGPEFAHELTDGVEGYRAAAMCHNGHEFKPGTTVDNDPPSPDWCDVCGEGRDTPLTERIAQAILAEGARLAAQHHEASEAHGRIKTMAAAFAAVARGVG